MSPTYSFNLTIDQKSVDYFVKNGFQFAVVKYDGISSNPLVQWFSVPLQGRVVPVSYKVGYQVFYTASALEPGQIIVSGSQTFAQTGNSYKYNQSSWEPSPGKPPVDYTQIGVLQNYAAVSFRNFGVNQTVTVDSVDQTTPITAAPIPNYGGHAIFQPTNSLSLYFTQGTGSGLVVNALSGDYKITLQPNVPVYPSYDQGVWSVAYGAASSSSSSFSDDSERIERESLSVPYSSF